MAKKIAVSPHMQKINARDWSPLKLTKEDAAFLNRVKGVADEAEAKAKQGKSGVAYYHVKDLYRLEQLGGRSKEALTIWRKQRKELFTAYPVNPVGIYKELRVIHRRNRKYKLEQQQKKGLDNG